MNYKQLEALIYVSRNGTFKKAAEALYFDSSGDDYVTPESIQYRIKQLEGDLGVSLYQKRQGSARVQLTREGQLFLREALEVYGRMSEWSRLFLDSEGGSLTFAATQAVIIHRLQEVIKEFHARRPRTLFRLMNGPAPAIEEMVSDGRIDFGLSTRPPEQSDLEYVLWRRTDLRLVTPEGHPLANRETVSFSEIADYPLVLLEPEIRGDREVVDEGFRSAGVVRPNVVMEVGNSEIILAYVEAGIGLSIIAETSLARTARRVSSIAIGDRLAKTEVGLLVRRGQYLPVRAREFLALLDERFATWLGEREERLGGEGEAVQAPPPERSREAEGRESRFELAGRRKTRRQAG